MIDKVVLCCYVMYLVVKNLKSGVCVFMCAHLLADFFHGEIIWCQGENTGWIFGKEHFQKRIQEKMDTREQPQYESFSSSSTFCKIVRKMCAIERFLLTPHIGNVYLNVLQVYTENLHFLHKYNHYNNTFRVIFFTFPSEIEFLI